MTPQEVIDAARRKYNSIGNNFYSDDEILDLLYEAENELSKEALTIEAVDSSTSTIIGTREYAFPTRCIAIKRLTYDGEKMAKISFRSDDEMTNFDEETSSTGTPSAYEVWGDSIFLRSVPGEVKTLKFYYYKEPTVIIVTGTIETPTRYHMDLVNKITAEMAYKDLEIAIGDRYTAKFEKAKVEAKAWQRKRQRADSFGAVRVEEASSFNQLGIR